MNKVINKKYIINFIFYIKNKVQGNVTAKDVWTGPYLLNFYDKGNMVLGEMVMVVGNVMVVMYNNFGLIILQVKLEI